MIDAFLLAILAGATGGLVVGVPAALTRGRRSVALEPGTRVVEADGREWLVQGRAFDVQVGQRPVLRVDLVLDRDPGL